LSTAHPRPPRADARRNYGRLLAEADAAFREHGTQASLENVARRAGVAIGTLYAHFPNRLALVSALLRERHDALFHLGDRLLTDSSAAEALTAWVRAVAAHAAAYRGLAAMLAAGISEETSELHAACTRMAAISERLAANARKAGLIRDDVTGADLFALMNAAAWVHEQISAEQADRIVCLAMAGMRPGNPRYPREGGP
jgi:AcrR family transcriptional regulator